MDSREDDTTMKNDSTIEEQENVNFNKNEKISFSPLPKFLQGKSRYGRTIIPKSPNTLVFESTKNLKMPKNGKQEIPEDESTRVEDTSSVMDETLNVSLEGSNKMEEEDEIDMEDLKSKCPWTLGQIVWARMSSFPFWPSVVTLDPTTMSYVTLKGSAKGKVPYLHVRFCADKGRHSWVLFNNVIPFLGLSEFEKRKEEVTPEIKKRQPTYAAALFIKSSMKLKWDDAVAEASGLMAKSVETRIELFKPGNNKKNSVDKSLNSSIKVEENSKKRKQVSTDEEQISVKKSKSNLEETSETNGKVDSKIAIDHNISIETPPTPPSSNKDSSDEAPISKKFKRRRVGKDGVFEIFCERNKESAEQLDPEATEADIKEYLLDLWENMSSQERSKYRADYLQEEEMRLYSLGIVEDEEEDEDSEPESEKPRRRRTKMEVDNEEVSDPDYSEEKPKRRKSKTTRSKTTVDHEEASDQEEVNEKSLRNRKTNKTKDEVSDQEETTSVESENLERTSRRRRTKTRRESSDREDVISNESELNDKSQRKRKSKIDKDEFSAKDESSIIDILKKSRQYKLFKGMKSERVCQICEKTGKLIRCKGPCYSYFHLNCVKPSDSSPEPSEAGDIEENSAYAEDLKEIKEKVKSKEEEMFDEENFKCIDCLSGVAPACFVCHERDAERTKCSVIACGKHYHTSCLGRWPQCVWQGGRLTCPYHVCHTCVSDNPQNGHPRSANDKFARCVRCPSTYHASIACIPAGSNILTGSQIVCSKHYKTSQHPVNATWCFLCTEGGSLICCDTCPMSFHVECLGINTPDGGFICEDCETGRLPLYGEVIWVKHSSYRWWPSVICYPQDIPKNIANLAHKTGEFCVMFLGSRDYGWIHRGKAFLFQDGDAASTKVMGSNKMDEKYRKALEEAKILHERLTIERAQLKDKEVSRHLKPPPYVKLKVNKPVGNVKIPEIDSMVACDCDPNTPNPCSPEYNCLNRILLIECHPDACPAGTKCQNQLFVQRKYPAMKPVHTEERGWGLKTLEYIKAGQFVIEYVGEIIDEAEYRLRLQQKKERKNENYYFLTIDNCRMIDAEPKGNLSRFMNHSCQPNCETQKWTVNGDTRIGLFALRDIQPNEELTFNYNLACDGETRKPCLCKAPNCSGFIGLKVPKNQISLAQQKKLEKVEKVKKQRKNRKNLTCWNCSLKIDNADEAYRCDQKTCGKVYHPHCIAIEDGPDQIFHCPWHFCAECYKRTSIRCSYCCNAFCQMHTDGNLREHPETGILICYNHPTEDDDDFNNMDMGEALMDDVGDDDEVVITNEFNDSIDYDVNTVPEPKGISSPSPPPQSDLISQSEEDSARGAIVEVRTSSEDDEVDEDDTQDENNIDDNGAKRRRRNKQPTESDFTIDQIAAIIGIVK